MANIFRAHRIDDKIIHQSLSECRRRFPGVPFKIISDVERPQAVTVTKPEELPEGEAYLLAYEQDDICASIMSHINSIGKQYFPCLKYYPVAEYWRTNAVAQKVLADEYDFQTSFEDHKWNTPDFVNIIQAIEATRDIQGSYVEVGVFKGNSAHLAVSYMEEAKIKRNCWFMDVFDGFNYEEAESSVDKLWLHSHKAGTPEAMKEYLSGALHETPSVEITVLKHNIITDDLPNFAPIAVANLDVDMYEAVLVGLQRLAPLIAPGGILIAEDPGHTPALAGAHHALTNFLSTPLAKDFTVLTMGSGQTFLLKR